MQDQLAPVIQSDALISVEQQRAIQEVQAQMIIAKRFPRDVDASLLKIQKACERKSLAKVARYSYPRGGNEISGPSIRIMEVIGQNWNNLNFGIAELSQDSGFSEVEAFAWDLETNVRMSKTFKVSHTRKAHGQVVTLTDPRDIYEHTASQGARRMRAALMAVIPRDIIEVALDQCDKTLASGEKPLEDRIREALAAFAKINVSKEMIETYLDTPSKNITGHQINHLIGIYNSLRDGMAKREDYFNVPRVKTETVSDLDSQIDGMETEKPETAPDINVQQVYALFPAGVTRKARDEFLSRHKKGNRLTKAEMLYIIENFDSLWNDKPQDEKDVSTAAQQATSEDIEADERMVLWSRIRKGFTIAEIEEVQRKMGLGVGASTIPPTLDGCQAVYDQLTEMTAGDFE